MLLLLLCSRSISAGFFALCRALDGAQLWHSEHSICAPQSYFIREILAQKLKGRCAADWDLQEVPELQGLGNHQPSAACLSSLTGAQRYSTFVPAQEGGIQERGRPAP